MTDSTDHPMSAAEKEAFATPIEQTTPFHTDPSVAPLLVPPDSSGLPDVVKPTEVSHSTGHDGLDPLQRLLDRELKARDKLFKHPKDPE